MSKVKVYLVGAGPGDEGLITLRALELLKQADCVIYDGLANDKLLRHVPVDAELISVRKRTGTNPVTQDTIGDILLDKIKQHKNIVRLKGGDPGFFGRASEEVSLLNDAGIDFEIVPGITAGMAAADYCGIFITEKTYSSQVIFLTGRESDNRHQGGIDFQLLAKFSGSIVIYMGMGNLQRIASRLISNGKDKSTPVAVIQNATRPNQRIVKSTLKCVVDDCDRKGIGAPAIVIIGPAADSNEEFNWFMNRPLSGTSVVITRDKKGNDAFEKLLNSYGSDVQRFDSIEIIDLTSTRQAKDALNNLNKFDWIIFTSANGVRHAFKALCESGKDARAFGNSKIATIGRQTADCLAEYGIRADFVPDVYTSEVMAARLIQAHNISGKKILLLRSEIAPKDINDELKKAGAHVTDTSVYTVKTLVEETAELAEKIIRGEIDWITFTSSSTVRSFFDQVDPAIVAASETKIASIGPVASKQIRHYNLKVDVQAKIHTIQGLADIIIETENG